jgi:ankyrin repeat protein
VDKTRLDRKSRSIVSYAAKSGNTQLLEQLLDLDSSQIDQPNNEGRSPLSYAATYGRTEVLKLLLARGNIQADRPDSTGRSPFTHAAQRGHVEAVKLLLSTNDVDPDRRDSSGRTPLSRACERGRVEVVQLLLGRPDDILIDLGPDNEGKTPMDYAREERRVWDEVLVYDHWDAYDEILLALDARNERRNERNE